MGVLALGGLSLATAPAFANFAPPKAKQDDKPKAKKADESEAKAAGVKVGDKAPDFTLTDTDGKTVKLSEVGKDKIVVLEWFNPECPFVVRHHKDHPTFKNLHKEFAGKGVVFLAINSGAAGKQGAGKDLNVKMKKDYGMEYPVLLDESGATGKAYGAKTTPHMFIIGKDGNIAYAGGIDDDRGGKNTKGAKNYVRNALNEMLAGKPVSEASTQAYGCSVKYKD